MEIFQFITFVLITLFGVFWSVRNAKHWQAEADVDFQAALAELHIETYELLVDRTVTPSSDTTAEIYRILHDQNGRYFLYMRIAGTRGVLKPLTRERALLAAKMSGYAR